MIPLEKLDSEDFAYFNLPEDEQRPLTPRVQRRLEEFQKRIEDTAPVARILELCGQTQGEPWKRWTPRAGDRVAWFNVGGTSSAKIWHATVFFQPRGVDVEVLGTRADLTGSLTKAGVNAVAELVRLCAKCPSGELTAIGCRECWYKYPESPYKGQKIDHTVEPLMEDPSLLVGATGDVFARKLFDLLARKDARYRTEFIIRHSIPREKITHKALNLSAQVGLVADALLTLQGPLAFLLKRA